MYMHPLMHTAIRLVIVTAVSLIVPVIVTCNMVRDRTNVELVDRTLVMFAVVAIAAFGWAVLPMFRQLAVVTRVAFSALVGLACVVLWYPLLGLSALAAHFSCSPPGTIHF